MRLLLFIATYFSTCIAASSQNIDIRGEYIRCYKDIAVKEMRRSGVPASIKLAQGILESSCGNSTLAKNANNHFGIKCSATWKGSTFMQKDDDLDEKGQLMESCFRVYENAEACYIAHSEFLCDPQKNNRYGFLFQLDPTDYKSWAKGLSSAGYATNPNYSGALIRIIEECRLYEFDNAQPAAEIVRIINDVKMVSARAGQTPEEIAAAHHLSTGKILSYNEGFGGAKQTLKSGEFVYLQRKRTFFRGGSKIHIVQPGDNMFRISQLYGIKLNALYRKNRLKNGTEPAIGQKIQLRGRVRKNNIPKLRPETETPNLDMKNTANESVVDASKELNPDELNRTPAKTKQKKSSETPDDSEDQRPEADLAEIQSQTTPPGKISGTKPNAGGADSTNSTIQYTVKAGDTLYAISRKFKMSIDEIKALNPGLTDQIKTGNVLSLRR